jgi:flagellar hook assembly protein FlgD
MKTRLIASIVLMGLVNLTSFAIEPTVANVAIVNQRASETFKLIYHSESTKKVTLNVYDKEGEIVFSETIKGLNKFSRPLNFKGMKAGSYTIEVVDNNGLIKKEVSFSPVSR